MLQHLLNLVFPNNCATCQAALTTAENTICFTCSLDMPILEPALQKVIEQQFWGKVDVLFAKAWLQFNKGGKAQKLLHQLKYEGKRDVGIFLGEQMALQFKYLLVNVNAIIPIPLHKKRERKRGYNQSLYLAQGIANKLNVTLETNLLKRVHYSSTQTKKSRLERWENVTSIFEADVAKSKRIQSILLVDDVITTGSTACAAIASLKKANPKLNIGFLAVAYAK